ncbi:MAG: acyltransferase [Bdellovibrionia bacterium]
MSLTRMTYIRSLDGLRGVSILLVLCAHTGLLVGGVLGVDIFFVLSGFLITSKLSQEWDLTGSISFKTFYLKRARKLFPVLFLITFLVFIVTHGFDTGLEAQFSGTTVLSILGGYENWAYLYLNIGSPLLAQTWSLSIEEQFYLFFPAFFFLLLSLRVPERGKVGIFFLFVVLSCALKILLIDVQNPHTFTRAYYGTDCRMDPLFLGAIFAVISGNQGRGLSRLKKWCIGPVQVLAAICVMAGYAFGITGANLNFLYFGGFTLFALAAAILILNLVEFDTGLVRNFLEFGPIVWLGEISYSLYLVHFIFTGERNDALVSYLIRDQAVSQYSLIGLEFFVSIGFAALCYYGLERKFIRVGVKS